MSLPLKYDLIIGFLFLAAAGIGARFGIFKLFLIFLALLAPDIIKGLLVLVLGQKQVLVLMLRAPLFVYFATAMDILGLVLVIWIIVRVPRAHAALSRASGALFAVLFAGWVAVSGSLVVSQVLDLREVRAKSLFGPVIFALGDRLIALLPNNPDNLFREKPAEG